MAWSEPETFKALEKDATLHQGSRTMQSSCFYPELLRAFLEALEPAISDDEWAIVKAAVYLSAL